MTAEFLQRPTHPLGRRAVLEIAVPRRDLRVIEILLERLGHGKNGLAEYAPRARTASSKSPRFPWTTPRRPRDKLSVHRHFPTALLVGALLAAGGCRKTEPGAVDDPWAATGFLRHVPAEAEGFLALQRPLDLWRSIAPAWQPLLEAPAVRAAWPTTAPGRLATAYLGTPTTAPLLAALEEAAREEVFVVLVTGTGAQLAALQQIKRLFEAARLRNLFTPLPPADAPPAADVPLEALPEDLASAAFTEVIVPLPPAMQESLEKFVRDGAIPPLLLGAKVPPDSALPRLLEAWVKSLPEKIPRDRVDAGPHGTFTRVRVPVTLLVPTDVAVRARDILAANLGDPYAATYLIRDLLTKVTTLGFGHLHGYFVVSIGTESGLPVLATAPENSLLSTPAMQRLEPLLGTAPAALFYADPLVVSLAAAPPPVAEYLDAALESALEFAPAETIAPLRRAADQLRGQAAELFRPRVSAVGGLVQQTGDVWRAELFGGSFAPRLALGNAAPLVAPGPGVDLLWTEHWEEGYARRLLDFTGGLAAFSSGWLGALGPVFLDPAQQARADALLRLVGPPVEQLGHAAGRLIEGAIDPHVFFALSLDGRMPPPPLLPAAAAQAFLPRLAAGAGLRDREALTRGWQELTASAATNTARWPEPVTSANPGGGASYEYSVPLGGPDLGLTVTVTDQRWILGSSREFNQSLTTLPSPAAGRVSVQTVECTTPPFASFAAAWATALAAEPALASITGGPVLSDPGTLQAAARLLQTPRRFHYQAEWEEDMLHRILELAPEP